jgi:hypothetical protein
MKTMWTGLFQLSSISLFMSFLFIVVCVLSCAAEIGRQSQIDAIRGKKTAPRTMRKAGC